jgi:DNA-binding NarL/FixJ family response regulator
VSRDDHEGFVNSRQSSFSLRWSPVTALPIRSLGVRAPAVVLPDGLSPRKAQILELVAEGLGNREIGEWLSISEHTAANHVRCLYEAPSPDAILAGPTPSAEPA